MASIVKTTFNQVFNTTSRDIILAQRDFIVNSQKLSIGQKYLSNAEMADGGRQISYYNNKSFENVAKQSQAVKGKSELELADSTLSEIKILMDQLKADALQGANSASGTDERLALGNNLVSIGENIIQLLNTKIGNKYMFSGVYSDKKTVDFQSGNLFNTAIYKEGIADDGERSVDGIQSSVSLRELLDTTEGPAVIQGAVVGAGPIIGTATDITLTINDGDREYVIPSLTLNAGDDIATIVANINAAFTSPTVGGTGTIVQDAGGGQLEFNTSLSTNAFDGIGASISIAQISATGSGLGDLGLVEGSVNGTPRDFLTVLNDLDTGYSSNDGDLLNNILADLEYSLETVVKLRTEAGVLGDRFEDRRQFLINDKANIDLTKNDLVGLDSAEAIQEVTASQAVLRAAQDSTSRIMEQSIFDFLNL